MRSDYRSVFVHLAAATEERTNAMERELLVYVDLAGTPVLAGHLWTRARGAKESASFEYDGARMCEPFDRRPGKVRGSVDFARRPIV